MAQSGDPTARAALDLKSAVSSGMAWPRALAQAETALSGIRDPEMAIVFLMPWADTAYLTGRFGELSAIVRRARSMIREDMDPVLRAIVMAMEGLEATSRGDKRRRLELLEQSISLFPRHSPGHRRQLLELARALAMLGREEEIDSDLEAVRRDKTLAGHVSLVRMIQAVETGRIHDARRHLADVKRDPDVVRFADSLLTFYEQVIALVEGTLTADSMPEWAKVIDRLLKRRPEEAVFIARRQAAPHFDNAAATLGFDSFNLIRAELAASNGETARRLLRMRQECGNAQFLDDLFMARVEWLARREETAFAHLRRLLDAGERWRALDRINFELRLACEVQPIVLLQAFRSRRAQRGIDIRESAAPPGIDRVIGVSRSIQNIRKQILRLAPLDAGVLITGETGTGKEVVARALHEAGPRRAEPFVAVNCGAIADSLLESELFGHERGAFTGADRSHRGVFEEAGKGTLFLDEIGEISPRLQILLLRVLETGEIRPVGTGRFRRSSCRIIAATNAELPRMIREGRFRQDLFYRLCRLELCLPPLRERPHDIACLAEHFLNDGRTARPATLSRDLAHWLTNQPWPGNVRELRNGVERMRLLHPECKRYELEHWSSEIGAIPSAPDPERSLLARGATPLRRHDRLRELFGKHEKLTRQEIIQLLGISRETASKDLKALIREGWIKRVCPTSSPRTFYFKLNPTLHRSD
jgi:DNA-binding NtrC family response regulator